MTVTTNIQVGEIHCASCERTIRTALSQLDGVLQVAPSAQTNVVRVSYDELKTDEQGLRDKLREVGYEPVS